ncbi:MAG: 5-formyltetrahydrofolate cyclo-ligase [Planctomycetota bacterium]|nr:5-formyltetrahydrofolate cyclo-ligase [Planctomycetota bacterium]
MDALTVAKRALRARIRPILAAMSPTARDASSRRIAERVLALPQYRAANSLMSYFPRDDEVDTLPLMERALAAGKTIALPRTDTASGQLTAHPVPDLTRGLRPGPFGIPEPGCDAECNPCDIDFVLVPGLAFDRTGGRLGRGKGFYDRFLSRQGMRAFLCGLAFEAQMVAEVAAGDTDVRLHAVVTENRVWLCEKQ